MKSKIMVTVTLTTIATQMENLTIGVQVNRTIVNLYPPVQMLMLIAVA